MKIRHVVILAFLLGSTSSYAKEDLTIRAAIDKKYGKSPILSTPEQRAVNGRKPDGSYWKAVYPVKQLLTDGGINEPRDWLAKQCSNSGGALSQSIKYGVQTKHGTSTDLFTSKDGNGQTFSVTGEMVNNWRTIRTVENASVEPVAPLQDDAQVDYLGLFSCVSSETPLWHVAILPASRWYSAVSGGNYNPVISIRIVDAPFVDQDRELSVLIAARAAQLAKLKAESEVRSAAFRQNLEIGSQTNCGLVLGFNGPLVEVQLKSSKERVFTQRANLYEPEKNYPCRIG